MSCLNFKNWFKKSWKKKTQSLPPTPPSSRCWTPESPPDSMLEMLNMISDLQSERMDSQRAELRPVKKSPKEIKATSLPGLRPAQTTRTRPEDDFLDMIARVQGSTRLDDQRSELPRPKPEQRPQPAEDDFFTNLMRAQAGRMEDQRASIPLKESAQNKAPKSKNGK